MGLMKQYLMERTSELASLIGIPEDQFYSNAYLTEMAQKYAQYRLELDKDEMQAKEEVKQAMMAQFDKVYDYVQNILAITCCGSCLQCKDAWMCARAE